MVSRPPPLVTPLSLRTLTRLVLLTSDISVIGLVSNADCYITVVLPDHALHSRLSFARWRFHDIGAYVGLFQVLD